MAGQAAGNTLESVRSAAKSVREHGGVYEAEGSAIGGEGRKGSDGYGKSEWAPHKNIADEFMKTGSQGKATTGQTGPNSGHGKTI